MSQLLVSLAFATVTIPVQGHLTSSEGPVSGPVEVTFRLDDSDPLAGPYLHTEAVVLTAVDGQFAALLSLDPAVLSVDDLYLSVQIGDGAPSDPVPVGWTPRAVVASRLTPDGAAAFRPSSWVPSWSDLSGAPDAAASLVSYVAGIALDEAELRAALNNEDLTIGTGSLTSGALVTGTVSAGAVTAAGLSTGTGAITGGAISGASLSAGSGAITGGAITGSSLSAGSGAISGGAITGTSLSAGSGAISGGAITGSSVSVGTGTATAGRLKLGADTTTACNAGNAGTIRWNGTVFQGCVGSAWISFGSTDGLTAATAAPSCKFIKDNFAQASGQYWIDVDGSAGAAAPFQTQCDMTTNGGGWTRISTGSFYSGANAYLVFDGKNMSGTSLWVQHKSGETRCNTAGAAPNAWAGCNSIVDGACGFVLFNGGGIIYDPGDYNSCRDNGGFVFDAARPAFGDRFMTRSTPFTMAANSQLAYYEDWYNTSESDNGGQHYVDIWIR